VHAESASDLPVHFVRFQTRSSLLAALTAVSLVCLAQTAPDYRAGALGKQEPQPIYASDPQDAWNRIFYLLFTRTVELRLADDFAQGGPLVHVRAMGNDSLPVTSRTFERIEAGDRAIDPLYPSFLTDKGPRFLVAGPRLAEFKDALDGALAEPAPRSPLHRALMQADVWAAHDILAMTARDNSSLGRRARELLPILGQFIRKLAPTPKEIAALPRNYSAAQASEGLPPVFDESSGWIEVEWIPHRLHDFSAGYRRAARVFLKPSEDPRKFLAEVNERLRKREDPLPDAPKGLDAVALVTEDLLVDAGGHVVPSPLTNEVQLRTFVKDAQGELKETKIAQYELSRKLFLADPSGGGLRRVQPQEPAYLPAAGNDYNFASPALGDETSVLPILGTLRRRCQSCHGEGASSVFTFLMIVDPRKPPPLIRQLRPAEDAHASFVATEKMKRPDFKSLLVPP